MLKTLRSICIHLIDEGDGTLKRILLKSVYDAFDYVMDHYYPAGQGQFAKRTDKYVVISIQDTHTEGFGFEFTESISCEGVLTLYFDDIVREVEGAQLFTEEDACRIIDFILSHKAVETLLIHCYGGESRSRAVAASITKMCGKDDSIFFETGRPNLYVYDLLNSEWEKYKKQRRDTGAYK